MPKKTTLAVMAYLALATADTALAARSGRAARTARLVTKPLLMPTLSTAFASARNGKGGTLAKGTAAAQALCWGGDVALLGKGNSAFLAGLSSFFAGHLCYLAAFASARERGNPLKNPGVRAAGGVLVTAAPVMALAAGRKEPQLRAPVAAYAGVLSSMFAASTAMDHRISRPARRTVVAGTTLFLGSDLMLGMREFLLKKDSHGLDAAVMATYAVGQGLIAAGVAHAVRAREAARPVS